MSGLPCKTSHSGFPTKICLHFSSPHVPCVPLISSHLDCITIILLNEQFEQETSHYIIFTSFMVLPLMPRSPVSTLISSSSAHVLHFMLRVQTSHPCEAPINLLPYLIIDECQDFWVSTGDDSSKEILQHQVLLYKCYLQKFI